MISKMFTLTLLLLCHLLLQSAVAEPPVNIPSQDYTAPFVSGGGGGHSAGGGYPSAGGGGGYPSAASGSGYNSNAAAYNAALDFNSNNQIGDGGGYSGGHGAGNGGAKAPLTSYGTPSYESHNGHNHEEYGEPKAYEFGYQVKDDYTGTNYNRQEKSDGNQVTGSYRVALPDGRTQIVTYYADWQTGFHADVRYEGEAHYPETYNNNNGYPNNNNNNNNNNNGYHQQQQPSQDYGVPSNNINNNNYNDNTGYSNNNYNNDRYDTYSINAFGNKVRPNQEYGAP